MPVPAAPTIDYNVVIDSNIGSQRIDYEYSDMLIHQRESSFPFTAFATKMLTKKAQTSVVYWFDTRPAPDSDTLTTGVGQGANNTGVAYTVGNPKYFKVGDIVEFPTVTPTAGVTTNVGIVTATAPTTITLRPHDPALVLAATSNGIKINIMYPSFPQGSGETESSLTRPIRGSNHSTILRDSYKVAKTTENERMFGAPERARARAEKEIKHLIDHNKLLYFGKNIAAGGDTTYQTNIRTMTKGLQATIVSNALTYTSPITSDDLFAMMDVIHENAYGGDGNMNRRLVFASSAFCTGVQKLTLSGIRFNTIPAKWGASVTELHWSGWTWDLVMDPQLTKMRAGDAFILQPRYLEYAPLRPTQFRANIQNPEVDYVKDEFITEPNMRVRLEEMHGHIRKVA